MKGLLFLSLFLFFQTGLGDKFNRIARTNEIKEEAKEAYQAGNFEAAASLYQTLIDSFKVSSDPVRLNYANSLRKTGKKEKAEEAYRTLATTGAEKEVRSLAFQQLGIHATENQNLQDAATYFKQSLKADPKNETARYNYELAKKLLEKQQQQEEQKQDKKVEPSEWAKELKKKAEQLVKQFRFTEAYELMQQGLKQDPTVEAFNNFTNRIGTIVEIEQK